MNNARVEQAIKNGLLFLGKAQAADGSFASLSSPTLTPFSADKSYKTTFTPAIILGALAPVAAAAPVRRKLAAWLLKQKNGHWSFNYWAKDAPERSNLPYPDDLDDTFCALIGLYGHDPKLIDGSALGSIVKLLLATESQVGGPYRTWLADETADKVWQDVDLAVNSNIAYFLSLVAEPLPNLTAMMDNAVRSGKLKSPYYPSAYPLAYYIARAYKHDALADYIRKQQRGGWWGGVLNSALAVSSLTRLGQHEVCAPAVEKLLANQADDGSWPAEAFCLDPAIKSQAYYSGAPALTTALVLEALAGFAPTGAPPAAKPTPDSTAATLLKRITGRARAEASGLDPSLKKSGLMVLDEVQTIGGHNEISLLPYLFNQSLKMPVPAKAGLLENLGLANLYGWMAYTVFDDFLDDEGRPPLLPVASLALRRSLSYFGQALPDHQPFQQLVDQTFDVIDAANAWEVANCRFKLIGKNVAIGHLPDYAKHRRLAERSLGHTLTPLAVLAAGGTKLDTAPVKHLRQALEHYLIARQLNDDLHDWEPDMRAGHATCVVTAILRDLSLKPGNYRLEPLINKMQRQFWHHSLLTLCDVILEQTALARQHARQSRLLQDKNIVTQLVDDIDAIVRTTLSEQTKAEQFLAAYKT